MDTLFDPRRNDLVLYINSICNLKCTYCYINKNPKLLELDKSIDDAFKTNYYVDMVKKIYTNHDILNTIELWGGEPLLSIDRILNTYEKLIELYPNLKSLRFSTNFTHNQVIPSLKKLCMLYSKFPERKFTVSIQISIDGQKDITDCSRGIGTTEKVIKNFNNLIKEIPEFLPKNVVFLMFTKSTMSSENLDLLCDKEYVISHFKFFEDNFIEKIKKLNMNNVVTMPTVYNFGTPYDFSKEDGIKFKEVCRLSREIEKENKENKIFKYYKRITPFSPKGNKKISNCVDYCLKGGTCSPGIHSVGLLPNEYISTCHRAFMGCIDDFYSSIVVPDDVVINKDSFKIDSSQMLFKINELPNFVNKIDCYYCDNSKNCLSSMAILIQMLAFSGQIDEKYCDIKEALFGARKMIKASSHCVYCNEIETGSLNLLNAGQMRLFLNGAIDYILEESL